MNNNNSNPNTKQDKSKTWLWTLLFLLIAVLSIWAVTTQSSSFTLDNFREYIKNASPMALACAIFSMLLFIIFEGLALMVICRTFGYKTSFGDGYIYSASDIYFSSITPSATGGQPASAYFMVKNGMSVMSVAAALLLNLCMYTLSIIAIGVICFIARFSFFLQYSTVSQFFIIIGSLMQILLALGLILLLVNDKLLHRISNFLICLLYKMRIFRNKEKKLEKLDALIKHYRNCAMIIYDNRGKLWVIFLLNFFQRASQIFVTVFTYMATTKASFIESIELFFLQGFAVLGANCMPVPGGVGISDYIMLDGFCLIMDEYQAVNLELLSRTLSFYFCVGICGISVIISYFIMKRKAVKK